jgi:hypothetical protein
MPKLVKITTFMDDKVGRGTAEKELTRLVNDGWEIETAGGGGKDGAPIWGFVILTKNDPDAVIPDDDDDNVQITY